MSSLGHPFDWADFQLHLCTTEAAYWRLLKRIKFPKELADPFVVDDSFACTHSVETDHNGNHVIVCLRTDQDGDDAIGLLCHEAVHVWQEVREHIGEEKPSSEFEAYSIQAVFTKLLAAYRKTKQ